MAGKEPTGKVSGHGGIEAEGCQQGPRGVHEGFEEAYKLRSDRTLESSRIVHLPDTLIVHTPL